MAMQDQAAGDPTPLYSAAAVARQWVTLERERQARRAALATTADLAALLASDLDLAQTAWAAIDAPAGALQALEAAARAATTGAAATLAQRFDEGQLSVQWPAAHGQADHAQLPFTRRRAALPPGRWVQALATAWIARDVQAVGVLADPVNLAALLDAAAAPPANPDALQLKAHYRRPWCELLAGLAVAVQRGERVDLNLLPLTEAARQDLHSGSGVNGDWLQAEVLGLAPLAAAIGAGHAARVAAAAAAAQRGYEQHVRAVADRLLPLPSLLLTGLLCLAQEHGLWQGTPDDRLHAVIAEPAMLRTGSVSATLAPRAARSAGEIHWYFDLLGAPRTGRSHRLESHADRLVATYSLEGWPGVPGATAAFVLRDDAQLLSPAQLLAVADRHAAAVALQPNSDLRTLRLQRAHLAEAVAALDMARARLPGAGEAAASGRLAPSSLAALSECYRDLLAQADARIAQAGAST